MAATLLAFGSPVEAREPRATRSSVETAERDAGEPVLAVVSIKTQHITVYDAEGWVHRAPVSTGVKGRETPAGVFAILQKNRDHRSNLYDDASMPHMQRLTWNGIALHAGPLPGYAASHGCIRMPYDFAETLFSQTRIGMRVIVSPTDEGPVEITHPALLVPNPEAAAAAPARADEAAAAAAAAAKAADEAKKASVIAAREAASFAATLKKLERAKSGAEAELAAAEKALAKAKSPESTARATERKDKATARAVKARTDLDAAKATAQPKLDAAAKAKDDAKAAADRKAETAQASTDARLAMEPVSIYISRSTQKVYVRRNTKKPWPDGGEVFDYSIEAPITIRDPDLPIGTHIFTAMAPKGDGLRWTAVSIDKGDTATNALDRISIPKEVLDRIAPTAQPRSSIVISDEPLSRETNYRTEFVAVLSNEPQGGFKTRKPTPTLPPMAFNDPWSNGGLFGFFSSPPPSTRQTNRKPPRGSGKGQVGLWW